MRRSARDCAAVLDIIAGPDASNPDTVDRPIPAEFGAGDLSGSRIGVVRKDQYPHGTDPALPDRFDAAVAVLEGLGANTVEITLPYWSELTAVLYVTSACEALAYHQPDLSRQWADYGRATRLLIAQGALMSGADYVQAQGVRRAGQAAARRLFTEVDVIASPTAAVGAPTFDSLAGENGHLGTPKLYPRVHTPYWSTPAR